MVVTNAVRNVIRRKGGFHLRSLIETGKKHGMVTMVQSVNSILEAGIISEDVAKSILLNYK